MSLSGRLDNSDEVNAPPHLHTSLPRLHRHTATFHET